MSEEIQVKDGGQAENLSTQEKETQVLEKAVEQGEIAPEAAGVVEEGVIKVNLDKTEEDAIQERETKEVSVGESPGDSGKVDEGVESDQQEGPIERITDEDEKKTEVTSTVQETEVTPTPKVELPENVEKLVDFMKETGGSLEDYINLNKNYDDMSDVDVIRENYKKEKPHLDSEEISFLMDDAFLFDKEKDDPRDIKKKQLAFKEALYDAKKNLQSSKDKYYDELKFNRATPEQQDALEFYNNSKKQEESSKHLVDVFKQKTDKVFNDDFKGFDFKVGEDKFRFKVQDKHQIKEYQSDINNFIGEFLGNDGAIKDAAGYHKAIYAARNADKIAQHFYEQGKADAIKNSAKQSKNIDMGSRKDSSSNDAAKSGNQFRVVESDPSKLKFKFNK